MQIATFDLHKWYSSARELESYNTVEREETETFAKQQLEVSNRDQASILGLPWNKEADTIGVNFPSDKTESTKRGILGKVAKIYDPLGLVAPVTLTGKLLYRDVCNAKLGWNTKLPFELSRKLMKWEESLPTSAMTKRSLPFQREEITDIHLHSFGDASGNGVAAAVYAIVFQPSAVNQGLVAAKARLAKQGLTGKFKATDSASWSSKEDLFGQWWNVHCSSQMASNCDEGRGHWKLVGE